jgi:NAD(P)-dependent dehydrogenase (short-subunit alcohol dehydrogenase family)
LQNKYPGIRISCIACDFEDLGAVVATAKAITSGFPHLDILINNAGTWENQKRLNADGFEVTWTVNYFAPYLLTHYLLPLLLRTAKESGDVRIINVGSEAHRTAKIDFDDLFKYSFRNTYGATKQADMLFTFKLARELTDTGITVNTVHPGVVATGLWKQLGPFSWLVKKIMISPERGARTSIFLASLKTLQNTGKYWSKCEIIAPIPLVEDITIQDKLDQLTRTLLKKYLS